MPKILLKDRATAVYLSGLKRSGQGSVRADLSQLPDGVAGTSATLNAMRALVQKGKTNPSVLSLARDLNINLPQKDYQGEIVNVFNYVQNYIRYIQDVAGVETLASPDVTIRVGQGDCDDKAILLASLLQAINHPAQFVALSFAQDQGQFSHVIVETALENGQEIAMDPTEPYPIGWYPPGNPKRMVVKV